MFHPEQVPVKVYYSSDVQAPPFSRSPNSLFTIFKACLVTGFGEKEGAGWRLENENEFHSGDLCLRLTNDDGKQVFAQVDYQRQKILECDSSFKYGVSGIGRWVLLVTPYSFWFLYESRYSLDIKKSGGYFYCGYVSKNTTGDKAIYLKHTGGSWDLSDGERYSLFSDQSSSSGGGVVGKLWDMKYQLVRNVSPQSFWIGNATKSAQVLLSPVVLQNNDVWLLPAYGSSSMEIENYQIISSLGRQFVCHGAGMSQLSIICVPIDYWEY